MRKNGNKISAGKSEDLDNLAFDFTLDDEDFEGFTRDCVNEHDVQQAFVYNSVLYTNVSKSPGPEEELYDTFDKGMV